MSDDGYAEFVKYVAGPALNGISAEMKEYERCSGMSREELAQEWREARDANDGLLMRVIMDICEERNRPPALRTGAA